ncbi:lanthionine synthetase C family protein [Actinokineospora terrae]|uniref:Lanthionine synthetase C-like protein n=1 Tax=Actinokineospora terrae TaxID=155974 RepID=A0A1H9XHA1_9PSEU|nr:lanthionine synthetase C family protein [Actinokineospora terrae]SES45439.1 Lanthionine synthetase C-like protein [Actinokineospora terrae]
MEPTTITRQALAEIEHRLVDGIAVPKSLGDDEPWITQSLSKGAAGVALLHIERALTGDGTWRQAHRWITEAVTGQVSASDNAGLYLGMPAIAFMLDAAASGADDRYQHALADIDAHVLALAHRRAASALERIAANGLPGFREYDVFFGLSGIGALLLRRAPGSTAMEHVLGYLVALTEPRSVEDVAVPGWWVSHDPHRRQSTTYANGHGNFGMAHGIAGPLALLSQAMRRGSIVAGQHEAINRICDWLDDWRQDGGTGPWWPEWITLAELRSRRVDQEGPARPSWCYGTPGIARAGQLAGIATGDLQRQLNYESALLGCLDDTSQQARIADAGLCHGWAGLYQTVWRSAQDADTPALAEHLPQLAANLGHHADNGLASEHNFLDGTAGTALALHTAAHTAAPTSGWDACLLID